MTIEDELRRGVDALQQVEVEVPPYPRLRRRQRTRVAVTVLAFVTAVSLAGLAVATGDDPTEAVAGVDRTTSAPSPATDPPGQATEAELASFCTVATRLEGERPEDYVGSVEHIDDVTALTAAAPAEIRPALETYRDFLAGGGVDGADPDSSLAENWPSDVRSAVQALQDYVGTHCIPSTGERSQLPADAARDGVIPELAELPLDVRSEEAEEILVEDDGSRWILSRPTETLAQRTGGGCLGAGTTYGVDFICTDEYDEILLLTPDGRIARAYPLPGFPTSWHHATADAVYAGRVGDGALPSSSIVRIDRRTRAMEAIVFPPPAGGRPTFPPGWRTATQEEADLYGTLVTHGADRRGTPVASWISADVEGIERLFSSP